MTFGQRVLDYEDEIIYHVCELIRIRSVIADPKEGMPYGEGIHSALTYVLRLAEQLGFTIRNVGGFAGHAEYGEGDEIAAVLVHVDTVPEGDGWSLDPFQAVMQEGRIYGRGASDNKGAVIAALFSLKAIQDAGLIPKKRLRIIFGTNEENGMTDLDEYFAQEPLPDCGFTPDAAYPIINAEKGFYVIRLSVAHCSGPVVLFGGSAPNVVPDHCYAEIDMASLDAEETERFYRLAKSAERIECRSENGRFLLEARGRSGHGSYPPSGINAVSVMVELLCNLPLTGELMRFVGFVREKIGFEAFGESLGLAKSDPVHGRLTINLGQMNVGSDESSIILNLRYPVTEDGPSVIEALRRISGAYGIKVEVLQHLEPLHVPADHPLIKKLSKAYEAITGEKAELLSIGGGTYARKLQNRGVAFGPGFRGTNTRAHQPDEFVPIDDLMRHAVICTQAMYELLGGGGWLK